MKNKTWATAKAAVAIAGNANAYARVTNHDAQRNSINPSRDECAGAI
jgi:hypothetical protein